MKNEAAVVTWDDPVASWKAASGLRGIEVLRAIEARAAAASVARLLGFEVDQVSEGLVTFAFEPAEFHYNPLGTVHGGIVTTVLDSAMGCAVHSRLRAGLSYTTLELKVNFLKPVRVTTGRVRGEGKVVHLGGRVATAEAHLVDGEGALYAHGTSTCLISPSGAGSSDPEGRVMAAVEEPPIQPAGAPGRVVHLDDGAAVTIRSVEPADAYPLLRMFDRLSPESIYHRFFSPMPRPWRRRAAPSGRARPRAARGAGRASGPRDRRRRPLRRPPG